MAGRDGSGDDRARRRDPRAGGHDGRPGVSAPRYVAVVGPSSSTAEQDETAERLGAELASRGHVVVCGGGGGVMAAASRGAAGVGGLVVGLLPGLDRTEGNPHLTVAIPTGLGELRNGLVVRAADVVVAVGGSWGTLSEVALAVRTGVPVVALGFWRVPDEAAAGGRDGSPALRRAADLDAALLAVDRLLADA